MSKTNFNIVEIIKACGEAGVLEFKHGDIYISFGKALQVAQHVPQQDAAAEPPQENYDYPVMAPPETPPQKPHGEEEKEINDFELIEEELRLSELKLTDPYAYEMKQLEEATHGDAIQ